MNPTSRKKTTKKAVKKVTMTDMMLIAHESGIFVITHPRSSDTMMLDIASFKGMSQIEGEKWEDLMKTALEECEKHRSFHMDFNGYDIMFTKALDLAGVYGAFRKPKFFVNGNFQEPAN
jgi:hypothetical protein